ncbi:MAG: NUDIX hydrolase [Actinomycetota bacterium]
MNRPSSARDLLDVVDHPDTSRPAIPAATVLLVRDAPTVGLEVLMIERGRGTSFGGMWAFPGGVIEADDVPAESAPDPLPAARIAAARETREEVGLVVDADSMVLWSHWVPPADTPAPKRFSTWFLLAAAGDAHGDESVAVDGREVRTRRWITPSSALDRYASGEIGMVAPTLVTLTDLARRASVEHAVTSVDAEYYATRLVPTDAGRWCLWHGDAAYESGDLDATGPRNRLLIDGERAPYERSDWPD